jgi:hypothetical protein
MAEEVRRKGAVKFVFWTLAAIGITTIIVHSFMSGQMANWYYYESAADGYAVNADSFFNATKQRPAILSIRDTDQISDLVAVPVKVGDRLPRNATGVIEGKVLQTGKRAVIDGQTIKVMIPWEVVETKGFRFRDSFEHKGIRTFGWAAVWNVVMVLSLGLALGYMAEGMTDLLGIKLEKIKHFEGH